MYNFPKYEPNKWNKNPYILFSHNCYAYALDIISKKIKNKCKKKIKNIKKKEGDLCKEYKPQPAKKLKMKNIEKLLLKDNPKIKKIRKNQKIDYNLYYKIALFTGKTGYHFYRQDVNMYWSHKPGWFKASNKDENKKLIKDPTKCNRGVYKKLIGFYKVPINKKIKKINH